MARASLRSALTVEPLALFAGGHVVRAENGLCEITENTYDFAGNTMSTHSLRVPAGFTVVLGNLCNFEGESLGSASSAEITELAIGPLHG